MKDCQRYLSAKSTVDEADIVLMGVPFDGTACFRPGARFGPQGIRFWSEVLESYSHPFDADLDDLLLADAGDLPISSFDWASASGKIYGAVKEVLQKKAVPILLGGEHLITLPAVEACTGFFPNLMVLQLDAHMDLRVDYEGIRLSHATVMRRVVEKLGPGSLLQYGIRSGTRKEWAFSEEKGTLITDPRKIAEHAGGRPLYLTLDLDVLDPSIMPETGAPEPGGMTFNQLHETLLALRGLNIVAGDVVEYCPLPGWGGPSGAVAAKAVRELIFLCAEGR
jgi:agmatinase